MDVTSSRIGSPQQQPGCINPSQTNLFAYNRHLPLPSYSAAAYPEAATPVPPPPPPDRSAEQQPQEHLESGAFQRPSLPPPSPRQDGGRPHGAYGNSGSGGFQRSGPRDDPPQSSSSTLGSSIRPYHHHMGVGSHYSTNPRISYGFSYPPPNIMRHVQGLHGSSLVTGPYWNPRFGGKGVMGSGRVSYDKSDRPYACRTCCAAFSRNHDLKRHEKIHLTVKPHPCVCGRRFSRKDALKVSFFFFF
jgi:hypothetical protein